MTGVKRDGLDRHGQECYFERKKEETMACKSKGGSCGTTKKTATKTPKKTKK